MREFSPEYLDRTRRGMWADDREPLGDLQLSSRTRVLDVGCGTGEFTAVLREETDATVVGLDADPELLAVARDRFDAGEAGSGVDASDERPTSFCAGDASRLPFRDDTFDLVVCQALLVNVGEPATFLREFARVSRDLIAAVEPVNDEVAVSSTVDSERRLERTAREAFITGARTGVGGSGVSGAFADLGVETSVRRYHHEKRIEPPYSEQDLRGARRKATADGLADHERELRRALSRDGYDELRTEWREMGREIVRQMREEAYRRVEVVPFDVTVGRVAAGTDG